MLPIVLNYTAESTGASMACAAPARNRQSVRSCWPDAVPLIAIVCNRESGDTAGEQWQLGQRGTMVTARKLAAEAIGTFTLVAAVCGAATVSGNAAGLGVALAVGLAVMSMIYAMGPVSGGHFNPAVTVGLAVAGRFEPRDIPAYVLAQVVGGALAALVFYVVLSAKADFQPLGFASNGYGENSGGGYPLVAAAVMEIVQTTLFVLVILRVTRPKGGAGIMAPVAIGLALTVMHIMSIPIANTSLNPARSTATALFAESWALQQLWLFWIAPLAGGSLAGLIDTYFGD